MCKNHSHVTVDGMTILASLDGTHVVLAHIVQEMSVQVSSTGATYQTPAYSTLLLVSPGPGGESSLRDRVTEALAALLCTDSIAVLNNGGDISRLMQPMP